MKNDADKEKKNDGIKVKIEIWLFLLFVAAIAAGIHFGLNSTAPERELAVVESAEQLQADRTLGIDATEEGQERAMVPVEGKEMMKAEVPLPVPQAVQKDTDVDRAVLQMDHLAGTLKITSPAVKKGKRLPLTYTCYWDNISPPIHWEGAPEGTQSFVLFMEQRKSDNPAFLNWALFNIAGTKTGIGKDVAKVAQLEDEMAQTLNGHRNAGYAGPCEPRGVVPYVFRLFALDTALEISGGGSREELIAVMNGHIIDAAELPVVHYFRM